MSRSILFPLLVLLLMAFTNKVTAQDDQKIFWHKDSLLTWNDFKGPVDKTSAFEASTYCVTNYHYNWRSNNNKYTLSFTTECYLLPAKSWSVKSKQSPQLLRHEQVHFDIAEFFARLLLQTLNKHTYTENHKAEVEQINQDIMKKKQTMQDLYDSQTDHSRNEAMQAQWEQYIATVLKASDSNALAAEVSGPVK